MREEWEITQTIQITSTINSQCFDKYLKSTAVLAAVKLWNRTAVAFHNHLFCCEMGQMKNAQINWSSLGQPEPIPANYLPNTLKLPNSATLCPAIIKLDLLHWLPACLLCGPFRISYFPTHNALKVSHTIAGIFLLNAVIETKAISDGYVVFLLSRL